MKRLVFMISFLLMTGLISGLQQLLLGEVDLAVERLRRFARVGHGALQHLEVHQRLAAEERDVRRLARVALAQRQIDGGARRLGAHELGLAAVFGVDDLVFAVFVAVFARQVALVGDVHHQPIIAVGGGGGGR